MNSVSSAPLVVSKGLCPGQEQIVRATLPLVSIHLGDITDQFYATLFSDHPQLLRDLFDRDRHAEGAQSKALAAAIVMYAQVLVNDDRPNLAAMMARVARRHASLGVPSEGYDLVYTYLFNAIAQVLRREDILGHDGLTAEIVDAWTAVYEHMASELRASEQALYEKHAVTADTVFVSARVENIGAEPTTRATLTLVVNSEALLPTFIPGQWVAIAVMVAEGCGEAGREVRVFRVLESSPSRLSVRVDLAAGTGSETRSWTAAVHAALRVTPDLEVWVSAVPAR